MQYCSFIRCLIFILLITVFGCALPVEGRQSSVPAKEIVINRLLDLSEKQIAASRFADATLTLDQITYLDSNLPMIQIGQIKAKLGLGLNDEALVMASRLVEEYPTEPKYKSLYAQVLASSGKRLEAVKIWRELAVDSHKMNRTEEEADYLRNIAESLFWLGREDEAYCASDEAYSLRPTSREEFLRYARLGFAAGKSRSVANRFATYSALTGTPSDPSIYLIRSYVNFNSGAVEQALSSLRTAKEFQGAPVAVSTEIEFFDLLLRFRIFPEIKEYSEPIAETLKSERITSSQALFWPPKLLLEVISAQDDLQIVN